ncbi:CobD/CbiB family protein [Rhodocyclus tenuis]|uniref:CobD/CbiB family protein n=1 Tax=Rhodocyclus tenuis TaxID=1066 RepID=UPI001906F3EF|nr:CobD/CbiB family protein [Rhodocyclus tenuis]MBK1679454.1 threonine-phosphate decarboxylase [Rhodocyclus tenuis]
MSLLSLVVALLLEQLRPLPYRRFVREPLQALADFLEARLNGGARQHGTLAWLIAVLVPALLAGLVFYALHALSPLLAWLWNVGVLYLTLGFRQFSHYFTDIQLALRMGDLPHARQLLGEWRGSPADDCKSDVNADENSHEIARAAISMALVASHRHVFGVLVCFVLLPGPSGAVLYRIADFLADYWGRSLGRHDGASLGAFGAFAARAFAVINWLPVRATAAGFAIVGNFEDAVYCWRTQADKESDAGIGIVLASGAGALGVRLVPSAAPNEVAEDIVEVGAGEDADADHMQSAVGLVWRALLLSLLLLLLLGFAGLAGA